MDTNNHQSHVAINIPKASQPNHSSTAQTFAPHHDQLSPSHSSHSNVNVTALPRKKRHKTLPHCPPTPKPSTAFSLLQRPYTLLLLILVLLSIGYAVFLFTHSDISSSVKHFSADFSQQQEPQGANVTTGTITHSPPASTTSETETGLLKKELEKRELAMKLEMEQLRSEFLQKQEQMSKTLNQMELDKQRLQEELNSEREKLKAKNAAVDDRQISSSSSSSSSSLSLISPQFKDENEEVAYTTGLSPVPLDPLQLISYEMPATTDDPGDIPVRKLFIVPVYDERSMKEVSQFAICVQQYMSRLTLKQQSEIGFIIYSIAMDRKLTKEMENWLHFDLIALPMDRIVSNAVKAEPVMNRQVVQLYILRHMNKRFRLLKKESELNPVTQVVVNRKNLFDLNLIRQELNMMDHSDGTDQSNDSASCGSELQYKKFALVVPFPLVQIPDVMTQLERWVKFKPCVDKPKIYNQKTDLIFYYHTQRYKYMEELILSKLSENGKPDGPLQRHLHCISPVIQFRYTNLMPEEDSYPGSANRMYYRLMFDNTVYSQYRYQFYAEPDTFPIRDGWLTRILDQAYVPDTSWWVSGSIYRGQVAFVNPEGKSPNDETGGDLGSLGMNVHVNGNALYSFSSDFREFMLEMLNYKQYYPAYDLGFTQYLFEFGWRKLRKVWHHFLFSDYIMNLWKTDWNEEKVIWESPNTYLVHSKQRKENMKKPMTSTRTTTTTTQETTTLQKTE